MRVEQESFLELLLRAGVLRFGSFVTKSGRTSPYFFNFGALSTGSLALAAGRHYADAVTTYFGSQIDVLFGPAYKGIPLSVMTAMSLEIHHSRDVRFAFNRKEAKEHGESGKIVGGPINKGDRVIIIEDVITGGTSLRESVPLLQGIGAKVVGAVVAIDRQERGNDHRRASDEIAQAYGFPVRSLLSLDYIVETLAERTFAGRIWISHETLLAIARYRADHGA